MNGWRKSSYSGEGDGNECVEIATTPTRIRIRDSKAPAQGPLAFPVSVFVLFLDAVRRGGR
ncbi:DUF397 domain-containing protein [Streptomyces sp. NPDC088789]|uniref:DUF397 domain-containing protein n=1 Tax=Streptomyces sp. NPDC088789 TaxID=3365899 RepID=UPI003816E5CC